MAPKFPNPDPPTDKVRDRLNQFVEVAGRAVYPPLAVAPSSTTAGQIWWDISDTVKIRNEANTAWDDLLAVLDGQPAGSYQPAGGYLRYDASQTLSGPQIAQVQGNAGITSTLIASLIAQIPYGAVGSHVMARCSLGTVAENTVVAGSTLNPGGGFSSIWINSVPLTYDGVFGSALSGQWRAMGRSWTFSDSSTSVTVVSLFVRIS